MPIHLRTALDLGYTLREHRRHHRLSQQALADRIGVSRQWVVEIEQGKERAEIGLVLRALNAVGADLSVLLPEEPPPASASYPPPVDLDAILARARRPLHDD